MHIKGALPCLVRWARRGGTRDVCPALAALVSPVPTILHSVSESPSPSNLGRQTCWVAWLCVSGGTDIYAIFFVMIGTMLILS